MKKLKKLKLQNAVLLQDHEMKMVTGGYGTGGYGTWGTWICTCQNTGEIWYCLGESMDDCERIDTCKTGTYGCGRIS